MKEKFLKWLFPKKYKIKVNLPIKTPSTFELAQRYVKARYGDNTWLEKSYNRDIYIVRNYSGEVIREVRDLYELTR